MSTAHISNTRIMTDPPANANGNGYHPDLQLELWGYPEGVQTLPELLAVLQGMSESLDALMFEAGELLEEATKAVAFAEERIRINLARERRRARRRERRK